MAARLRDFRTDDPAPTTIPIDGRIEEVDRLTVSLNRLSETIRTQQESLASRESRESTFVSDVAHELRTPLTAIRGNAEMLSDPDLPPAMREKFTGIIVEESRRLDLLLGDSQSPFQIFNVCDPRRIQKVGNIVTTEPPILFQYPNLLHAFPPQGVGADPVNPLHVHRRSSMR